jgi:hypothetical protein
MTWYKAVLGSPDAALESQGTIYLNGSGTDLLVVEVDATFEFRTPCATAVTPAERGALECEKEKTRLLKLLGFTPAPAAKREPDTERSVKSLIPTG